MNAPIFRLYVVFVLLFVVLIAFSSRWAVFGATGLREKPQNKRVVIEEQQVKRGVIRAANGEVPTLNYDPFCACQDQGDFVVTATAVAQSDPNAAEANVAFTNMGEKKSLKLKLVREGPNWKVDDIIDGTESLHDALMAVAEAAG